MSQHSKRTQARIAVAAALPLAAILALAGCSTPSSTPSPGSTAPVTLTFSVPTETNPSKPYATTATAYEKLHPNVTIKIVETPLANYGDVLKTQLQGGTASDIIFGTPGYGNAYAMLGLADAGYLLPLSQYSWATHVIQKSADSLYYSRVDKKLYGIAIDSVPIPWIVNQDSWDKLGITPPTTFAEVLKDCKVAKDGGTPLVQLAGAVGANAGIFAMEIAGSRVYASDPNWNVERAANKVTFANTPGWKDTMQAIVDMNKANCFQPGVAGAVFDDLFTNTAQGISTSMFGPAGVSTELVNNNPSGHFTLLAFPGVKASDTFVFSSPTNSISINAATTHKEAALDFLKYFTLGTTQDAVTKLNGNVSLRGVLENKPLTGQFKGLTPYLTNPKRTAPLANITWENGDVYTALGSGVQGLLTGQATVTDVLKNLDAAWDE